MKKLFSLVFALILVMGVFSANAESPKLESILKSGKLICATDAAWAPFEYIGENGAVMGCEYSFRGNDLGKESINDGMKKASGVVQDLADQVRDAVQGHKE